MTHASLSPSARHRWSRCPGSVRESTKYPGKSSPASIDGTHTHTLLEYCIKSVVSDASTLVGLKMTDHDGEFVVDRGRAERVNVALSYIQDRIIEEGIFDCVLLSEQKVNPVYLLGRDNMSGTVDIQIRGTDILELIDYKDGVGVVDVIGNEQLEQYAYGVLSSFQIPFNKEYPFKTVRMTIIQPKLTVVKGLPAISSYDISVENLIAKVGTIIDQADAASQPDAPLVPGEKQCQWCPAKGNCAALTEKVMEKIDIIPLDLAQRVADKKPNEMSDEQIKELLEAAPLLRQLIESVETEALIRLKAGGSIAGFKLVYGRGSRAWSLPDEQTADKLIKMGVPKGSIYEQKLVSPAQAEKLSWVKRDGTKMSLSANQIELMNKEYISKKEGKLAIAPESDSRESVIMDVSSMFGDISIPEWLK